MSSAKSVSENATPGFLVWRLSTKWRVAVDRAVGPLGLTHAQYSLVASLYGMHRAGEHPSQRRLADHTGLEPLYVSKLARSLEAAGLLDRTRDPADPRAVRLTLTDDGREITLRAVSVVQDLLERLLEPLGGLGGERARAFGHELAVLLEVPLDVPLDPHAGAGPRSGGTSPPSAEVSPEEQP
ncbi:MarR family transcriptional regulator [Streptomyces populi]|uniref:MarR family transcriptional regulator n=1 Tax=Streptomyces populi TaxID=2058924 RepID=A0A2I0SXA9_9ACTN|nr:MarR family transcriptional regulator [Streptomyces populi]PKT74567.1 MarR family transcriptional regulator [Streptomyces populi]